MSVWVLVRGLTREARHWAELPEQLQASGIEGEFVFADLPGTGVHAHQRAPASIEAMVEFVRADMASRAHAAPYSVIAMSLGAMVATAWAQRAPHEIERLVLINTSMRPYSTPLRRLRPRAWPEMFCAAARWHERRDAEAAIHNLTCNQRGRRDTDLAAWIDIYRSAPVTRANALRQLWAAARFSAGRAPPLCPTLVVSSRADGLVHPACSAQIARAWDAAHREHPWAGHDLPHDDAAWLAQAIAAWACDAGGHAGGRPTEGSQPRAALCGLDILCEGERLVTHDTDDELGRALGAPLATRLRAR